MARRHVTIRKTDAFYRNDLDLPNDDDDLNSTLISGKNTNQEMYNKNSLYNTMCIYKHCNERIKGSLVQHYRKCHSDREKPISRMSPAMANKLRKQGDTFYKDDNNKITGLCYFCEESHSFLKYGWQTHLIAQTGERMFYCTHCGTQLETKKQHDKMPCKNRVENIVKANENGLVGFMCKDCNYFQFSSDRIIAHLKNEHGFENPLESINFKEVIVVKNV